MKLTRFFLSYLFPQTIKVVDSPLNGPIKVIKFFGQNKLEAGGLTQSGEYVEDLLAKALKGISSQKNKKPKYILILGLGGGSIVKRMNKLWPKASIVGVEIDKVMVELGRKYLFLNQVKNLEIVIDDAIAYVRRVKDKEKFDLILVDLYLGYEFPKAAESIVFLNSLQEILAKGGVVIFNRLYFKKYRKEAEEFIGMAKKVFPKVSFKKVYSNILIFAE